MKFSKTQTRLPRRRPFSALTISFSRILLALFTRWQQLNNPYILPRCNPDMQSPAPSIRSGARSTGRLERQREDYASIIIRETSRSNPGLHIAQLNHTSFSRAAFTNDYAIMSQQLSNTQCKYILVYVTQYDSGCLITSVSDICQIPTLYL